MVGLIIIFFSVGLAVIIGLKIRSGKLKLVDTYSYKAAAKRTTIGFVVVVVISLLVYCFSKSFEVTVSLGVLFLFAELLASLLDFLGEYNTKRRGGRKID